MLGPQLLLLLSYGGTLLVAGLNETSFVHPDLQRLQNSSQTAPDRGWCSTWGAGHFSTFDGHVYDFLGTCNYIFAATCKDTSPTFSVQLRRGPGGGISRVIVELGVSVVTVQKAVISVKDVGVVGLPYTSNGLQITPFGQNVQLVAKQLELELVVMWGPGTHLMVLVEKRHMGKLCGLCGDFNGEQTNEFLSEEGKFLEPHTYAALQTLDDPDEICTYKAVPNPQVPQAEHAQTCTQLLTLVAPECNVPKEPFMWSCQVDMAECVLRGQHNCSCATLSEYSRQCSMAGQAVSNWRGPGLCPVGTCPANQVYQECGETCVKTCSNPQHTCSSFCTFGCFCPKGTVLDDISRNHTCVPVTQCPCMLNGVVYAPGEVVTAACQTCQCTTGHWKCTEQPCPQRCSLEGGSFVTTFDARPYRFHGTCTYILLQSPQLPDGASLVASYDKSGYSHSETALAAIIYMSREDKIVISQDEVFTHNGNTKWLPYKTRNITVFRQTSTHIQMTTTFGLELVIQLEPVFQAYITIGPQFRGQTRGLCGTFNGDTTDDFMASTGIVEGTASLFVDSWRTGNCPASLERETDPCSMSQLNKVCAETHCSVLVRNGSVFEKCHAMVNPRPFYKRCVYQACNYEKTILHVCAALSDYARVCATRGILLRDWRNSVDNCTTPCTGNQTFGYDTRACGRTCLSLSDHAAECHPSAVPVDGCNCPEGTYLNHKAQCVRKSQCPCLLDSNKFILADQSAMVNGVICYCINGRLSCPGRPQMLLATCSAPKTFQSCNESSENTFGAACAPTCQMLATGTPCVPTRCEPGCVCAEGLYENANGQCVPPEECPCEFAGASYPPGAELHTDCRTCTCSRGKWTCWQSARCSSTCALYGEGHVVTFDGQRFMFDGSCGYILTTDGCGANNSRPTFTVLTENVVCGKSGVTCSRSIKISLGGLSIVLADRNYTVSGEDPHVHFRVNAGSLNLVLDITISNRYNLTLVWNKHMTIFIKITRATQDALCGLCGNYNGNMKDDFETRSNYVASSELEFVNSWKDSPLCGDTSLALDPCSLNTFRRAWAERKCGIINSPTFAACHSQVYHLPYYEACVQDACGCDTTGDCECLCDAVAAYAKACLDKGVCVDWRTPDFCPIYCDYYNTHTHEDGAYQYNQDANCTWHYQPCLCPQHPQSLPHTNTEGCYNCSQHEYFDQNTGTCVPCMSPPTTPRPTTESPRSISAITPRATSAPTPMTTLKSTATGPTETQTTMKFTASMFSSAMQSTARSTEHTTAAPRTKEISETSRGPPTTSPKHTSIRNTPMITETKSMETIRSQETTVTENSQLTTHYLPHTHETTTETSRITNTPLTLHTTHTFHPTPSPAVPTNTLHTTGSPTGTSFRTTTGFPSPSHAETTLSTHMSASSTSSDIDHDLLDSLSSNQQAAHSPHLSRCILTCCPHQHSPQHRYPYRNILPDHHSLPQPIKPRDHRLHSHDSDHDLLDSLSSDQQAAHSPHLSHCILACCSHQNSPLHRSPYRTSFRTTTAFPSPSSPETTISSHASASTTSSDSDHDLLDSLSSDQQAAHSPHLSRCILACCFSSPSSPETTISSHASASTTSSVTSTSHLVTRPTHQPTPSPHSTTRHTGTPSPSPHSPSTGTQPTHTKSPLTRTTATPTSVSTVKTSTSPRSHPTSPIHQEASSPHPTTISNHPPRTVTTTSWTRSAATSKQHTPHTSHAASSPAAPTKTVHSTGPPTGTSFRTTTAFPSPSSSETTISSHASASTTSSVTSTSHLVISPTHQPTPSPHSTARLTGTPSPSPHSPGTGTQPTQTKPPLTRTTATPTLVSTVKTSTSPRSHPTSPIHQEASSAHPTTISNHPPRTVTSKPHTPHTSHTASSPAVPTSTVHTSGPPTGTSFRTTTAFPSPSRPETTVSTHMSASSTSSVTPTSHLIITPTQHPTPSPHSTARHTGTPSSSPHSPDTGTQPTHTTPQLTRTTATPTSVSTTRTSTSRQSYPSAPIHQEASSTHSSTTSNQTPRTGFATSPTHSATASKSHTPHTLLTSHSAPTPSVPTKTSHTTGPPSGTSFRTTTAFPSPSSPETTISSHASASTTSSVTSTSHLVISPTHQPTPSPHSTTRHTGTPSPSPHSPSTGTQPTHTKPPLTRTTATPTSVSTVKTSTSPRSHPTSPIHQEASSPHPTTISNHPPRTVTTTSWTRSAATSKPHTPHTSHAASSPAVPTSTVHSTGPPTGTSFRTTTAFSSPSSPETTISSHASASTTSSVTSTSHLIISPTHQPTPSPHSTARHTGTPSQSPHSPGTGTQPTHTKPPLTRTTATPTSVSTVKTSTSPRSHPTSPIHQEASSAHPTTISNHPPRTVTVTSWTHSAATSKPHTPHTSHAASSPDVPTKTVHSTGPPKGTSFRTTTAFPSPSSPETTISSHASASTTSSVTSTSHLVTRPTHQPTPSPHSTTRHTGTPSPSPHSPSTGTQPTHTKSPLTRTTATPTSVSTVKTSTSPRSHPTSPIHQEASSPHPTTISNHPPRTVTTTSWTRSAATSKPHTPHTSHAASSPAVPTSTVHSTGPPTGTSFQTTTAFSSPSSSETTISSHASASTTYSVTSTSHLVISPTYEPTPSPHSTARHTGTPSPSPQSPGTGTQPTHTKPPLTRTTATPTLVSTVKTSTSPRSHPTSPIHQEASSAHPTTISNHPPRTVTSKPHTPHTSHAASSPAVPTSTVHTSGPPTGTSFRTTTAFPSPSRPETTVSTHMSASSTSSTHWNPILISPQPRYRHTAHAHHTPTDPDHRHPYLGQHNQNLHVPTVVSISTHPPGGLFNPLQHYLQPDSKDGIRNLPDSLSNGEQVTHAPHAPNVSLSAHTFCPYQNLAHHRSAFRDILPDYHSLPQPIKPRDHHLLPCVGLHHVLGDQHLPSGHQPNTPTDPLSSLHYQTHWNPIPVSTQPQYRHTAHAHKTPTDADHGHPYLGQHSQNFHLPTVTSNLTDPPGGIFPPSHHHLQPPS
ncbi:mucin-6-like [Canis lupus familiaris]|uniref:mucin-6-like n=1 Tax=Canis lupus familiaris TaxID=9615 RepID=UPI0018F4A713|nr:mucin-6-like [Canis lupus familiaris]